MLPTKPTRPSPVFAGLRGAVAFAFASKTNGGPGTAFRLKRLCVKLGYRVRVFLDRATLLSKQHFTLDPARECFSG